MRAASRALLIVVALRFIVHVLYVPAYEGPDEPFHLAHAEHLGLGGAIVSPQIVASVAAHPCGADLQKAFGCPPFGSERVSAPPRGPIANYEFHQPPGYYVVPSLLPIANPITKLMAMRFFSVLLVLIALFVLRAILPPAALVVLLIPGAAESLARGANDSAVFFWTALVVFALHRRVASPWLALLAALGPLMKLTAIPIIALLVVWTFLNRPRVHAAFVALASLAFVPLQWLRGFAWGGTVELNASRAPFHESLALSAVGLARSGYTFAKTAFWLGEWSFFRAPLWLLACVALLIIAIVVSMRRRSSDVHWQPHVATFVVAIAATLWWFVSHRLYWGDWGGVGGWYAWAWFPWLAVALPEFFTIRRGRALFIASAIVIVVANVAWFAAAHSVYAP